MNEPTSSSIFSRLVQPMEARAYYRRTGFAFLALAGFIACAAVILRAFSVTDTFGFVALCIFAALPAIPGIFRLRKAAKSHPGSVVHQTLETAPLELQERVLRRQAVLGAIAFPLLTLMTVYQLLPLERGEVGNVDLWFPIAFLYRAMGFWPTVVAIPSLGMLVVAALLRRIRVIRAARER